MLARWCRLAILLGTVVGTPAEETGDPKQLCCRCVKGTDIGSDALVFSLPDDPKNPDEACYTCCGQASTEYHSGGWLKEEFCSGKQAQDCSPGPNSSEDASAASHEEAQGGDKCTAECQGVLEGMMLCCARHKDDGCIFDNVQSKCVTKPASPPPMSPVGAEDDEDECTGCNNAPLWSYKQQVEQCCNGHPECKFDSAGQGSCSEKSAFSEEVESAKTPGSSNLCCRCVKGTDVGSDAVLFSLAEAPKDADAACNECCADVGSMHYQFGDELKQQFCKSQAQDCSLLSASSIVV